MAQNEFSAEIESFVSLSISADRFSFFCDFHTCNCLFRLLPVCVCVAVCVCVLTDPTQQARPFIDVSQIDYRKLFNCFCVLLLLMLRTKKTLSFLSCAYVHVCLFCFVCIAPVCLRVCIRTQNVFLAIVCLVVRVCVRTKLRMRNTKTHFVDGLLCFSSSSSCDFWAFVRSVTTNSTPLILMF